MLGARGLISGTVLGVLAVAAAGCRFGGLQEDLDQIAAAVVVEGHVVEAHPHGRPILVALVQTGLEGGASKLAGYRILSAPGEFRFNARLGSYRLAAFEDLDEDLAQGAREPWGALAVPPLEAGAHVAGLEVKLLEAPAGEGDRVRIAHAEVAPGGFRIARGDVVPLEDARFDAANGDLGLWEPVKFLERLGAGIYFLEPYDPKKVPVLFVHGAAGFPQQWKTLVAALDRSRFQPWIFHYPSGMRLSLVADAAARTIGELRLVHGFDRLAIVAHSMGGLVSRATIQRLVRARGPRVTAFVTISTPWRGHEAAQIGLDYAPAVVPSWIDMAPGSEILKAVAEKGAWDAPPYTLLFGYEGGAKGFDGNGDGAVALASVLDAAAQARAVRVRGFPENHTSVLTSAGVAEEVKGALERAPGER